jgi:single-stranded DNA-binding protein
MRGIESAFWGSATKDGEVRESKSGNSFGIINVAVNEGKQDDAGKDVVTYLKVLLFGQLASKAGEIKRGDRCYTEGTLSAGIWQSQDGPRLDLSIRAFRFERTGIGKQRPRRENGHEAAPDFSQPAQRPGRSQFDLDDEIPF